MNEKKNIIKPLCLISGVSLVVIFLLFLKNSSIYIIGLLLGTVLMIIGGHPSKEEQLSWKERKELLKLLFGIEEGQNQFKKVLETIAWLLVAFGSPIYATIALSKFPFLKDQSNLLYVYLILPSLVIVSLLWYQFPKYFFDWKRNLKIIVKAIFKAEMGPWLILLLGGGLFVGMVIWLTALIGGSVQLYNGIADHSIPQVREFVVLETRTGQVNTTPKYYVTLKEVHDEGASFELKIPAALYNQLERVSVIGIMTKKGALGIEWRYPRTL